MSLVWLASPAGNPHLCAEIDLFEMTYRRIAGHIIRTSHNAPAVSSRPTNIQYVTTASPEYLAYLSTYNDGQGNGDGPAV